MRHGWSLGWRRPRGPAPPPPAPACVAVGSGKGGTGKSLVAANLAVRWARRGHRVLLVDADLGLANAHLLLGVSPPLTLAAVVRGEATLAEAVVSGPSGVALLAGGVGVPELAGLAEEELYRLAADILALARRYDRLVVDTAAGLGPATLLFLRLAAPALLVTTPDVTALTDAYALLKALWSVAPDTGVHVLVNRVQPGLEPWAVYARLARVAAQYLGRRPRFLGGLPEDPAVPQALARRAPLLLTFPRSPFARAFLRAARALEPALPLAAAGSCATL